MNFEQARHNMIEQQIRPWEILDPAVLDLLALMDRDAYVPAAYRNLAFADFEIPLGAGASMWAPKIEAHALQALSIKKQERVLEIGTGSGFMAALLAAHADHVWTVEIDASLARTARRTLEQEGVVNVSVVEADGASGLAENGPYDAILISGGMQAVPPALLDQLKVGGRLFAFVGDAPAMSAQLITRTAENAYSTVSLFETTVALLRNFPAKTNFSF
jgi:protein-L-isoaspartate(D-aspartate) O-methyltransferase